MPLEYATSFGTWESKQFDSACHYVTTLSQLRCNLLSTSQV
jgi:hypothetical protein